MNLRRSHVLTMLAAAPFAAAPARVSAQAPKLRVAYTLGDPGMEAFYAQDQGFFARAGLDVDLLVLANAPAMMEAVVGNAVFDVGFADALQLGTAFLRGVPLAAFAGGVVYSTEAPIFMVVAKNSPIQTAKDLEGQAVGTVAIGTSTLTLAVRAWLEQTAATIPRSNSSSCHFRKWLPRYSGERSWRRRFSNRSSASRATTYG